MKEICKICNKEVDVETVGISYFDGHKVCEPCVAENNLNTTENIKNFIEENK